ncbi:hypothetical protein [Rhizobium leguminosarum]|uniref:hypothetical protein n=1 Tax=Rhizobium leguminosarum TaxID=384 RepID=UPI0014423768|nr:hypothetical protein [Rhizobium leguminosarum]MBY5863252.1 hypothetical protein [Rhizobium leguminosarum]NKM04131.1 hypothetical protein [Rhizobium leguminosarum bv. viciae]
MRDNTYTPLRADFDNLMENFFSGNRLSPEQRKIYETLFFAGASSAYGVVVRNPEQQGTLFEELKDYSDQMDRVKV